MRWFKKSRIIRLRNRCGEKVVTSIARLAAAEVWGPTAAGDVVVWQRVPRIGWDRGGSWGPVAGCAKRFVECTGNVSDISRIHV